MLLGLHYNKHIINGKYHTWKMHWIHLTYQTSHLAAQPTVEYWLFPSWSRGWLGATDCCLCPASQDSIIFHSTGSGKVPNSTSEVGFLLHAYCFHTIVKRKKKSLNRTFKNWGSPTADISNLIPIHPSQHRKLKHMKYLTCLCPAACWQMPMCPLCSLCQTGLPPHRGRTWRHRKVSCLTPTITSGLGYPSIRMQASLATCPSILPIQ